MVRRTCNVLEHPSWHTYADARTSHLGWPIAAHFWPIFAKLNGTSSTPGRSDSSETATDRHVVFIAHFDRCPKCDICLSAPTFQHWPEQNTNISRKNIYSNEGVLIVRSPIAVLTRNHRWALFICDKSRAPFKRRIIYIQMANSVHILIVFYGDFNDQNQNENIITSK